MAAITVLGACGAGAEVDVVRTATPGVPVAEAPPSEGEAPAAEDGPNAGLDLPPGEDATVVRVVDGDTIEVAGGTRVRLIGIDTPETKDPSRPVQCFGPEASSRTSSLLATGTAVRLVYDVDPLDRYGRALAYVYRLDDGLFVNAELVAEGYAIPATYPPNVAHAEDFARLGRIAQDQGAGLWSACGAGAAPPVTAAPATPSPAVVPPTAAPAPVPPAGSFCDASYPGVCIPAAPPDLDCGDISPRRFSVLPPDPHGFDGDADGVGCESG